MQHESSRTDSWKIQYNMRLFRFDRTQAKLYNNYNNNYNGWLGRLQAVIVFKLN